jgi:hypothetical protein
MAENTTTKHKRFNVVRHPPQNQVQEQPILNPEVPSTTASGGRITETEAAKINASVLHPERQQSELQKPTLSDTCGHETGWQQTEATLNLSHEQDKRFGLDKGQPVPIRSHSEKERKSDVNAAIGGGEPTLAFLIPAHEHTHETKEKEREKDRDVQPGVGFIPEKDRPHLNLSGEQQRETSDVLLQEKRMRDLNLNEPAITPVPTTTTQRTQAPITAHTLPSGRQAEPVPSSMGAGRHESTYEQPAHVSYAKPEVDGQGPMRRDEGLGAVQPQGATWENPKTRDARMADQTIDRSQYAKQT